MSASWRRFVPPARSQKNDQPPAVSGEIEAIARTGVDPVFQYPFADTFDIGDRAAADPVKREGDPGCLGRHQIVEPESEQASSPSIDVFLDFDGIW